MSVMSGPGPALTWIKKSWIRPHCKEDPICVFKLCGLNPSFHIYVSVSDSYIPTIGPPIFISGNICFEFSVYKQYHCRADQDSQHNTGTINILFLFFRYVRMHNCPFHSFPLPLLSTSLICRQKLDGASHPCTAHFTVSYCNNFLIFSFFP
jgi:hypothetical protein